MNLNKLYEIADKENITIINFKMKNKAIIGRIDKKYCIRFKLLSNQNLVWRKGTFSRRTWTLLS